MRRLPVLGIGGVLLGLVSLNDIALRAVRAPAGDSLREGLVETLRRDLRPSSSRARGRAGAISG